jgi:hypothetical protein
MFVRSIEEVKGNIKHLATFWTSQQEVAVIDIIQNSAVGNFSSKPEGTKTKAAVDVSFLLSFPFLYILKNSLQSSLTIYIFPSLSAC